MQAAKFLALIVKCQAVAVFNTNTHVIVICWLSIQTTVLAEHQRAKPNHSLEANRLTWWTIGHMGHLDVETFENRNFYLFSSRELSQIDGKSKFIFVEFFWPENWKLGQIKGVKETRQMHIFPLNILHIHWFMRISKVLI